MIVPNVPNDTIETGAVQSINGWVRDLGGGRESRVYLHMDTSNDGSRDHRYFAQFTSVFLTEREALEELGRRMFRECFE